MQFAIDEDAGSVIRGWVTPDDPRAISRVAVSVGGRRIAEIAATEVLDTVRHNGWHATGQCGFIANESNVPGLAQMSDLEIFDVESNMLVYRRCSAPGQCQGKLVLLNMSINPESVIQAALFPHFRLNYFGAGRFSEQIMVSLLGARTAKSCLLSGRFVFPRFESHIDFGESATALLVHDPYVEMASRLIWLRQRAGGEGSAQPWRLGELADAAAFAKDYDYTDVKALKHFLRMLPQPAYQFLYNPLTRQFGTYLPEDFMMPAHSVLAVEALARVGIVGHYDYFAAFMATVYDRLGIDAPIPAPAPIPPDTLALAERLRSIKAAREFVVFDAAMSEGVRRSVARSWAD